MIGILVIIMIIIAIVFLILSICTYDEENMFKTILFTVLFVIMNGCIYICTTMYYPKLYISIYNWTSSLGFIINAIIIVVAIFVFIFATAYNKPYIYLTLVVIMTHIYTPIALVVGIILGIIMLYAKDEVENPSANEDNRVYIYVDSSDSYYDYESLMSDDSSDSLEEEHSGPSSLTQYNSEGYAVETFVKGVDGSYTGSSGTVWLKDQIGGGYYQLNNSLNYIEKDCDGSYTKSDGTRYTIDSNGNISASNGDYFR